MTLSVLVKICVFMSKVCFKLQNISMRSQKLCLTILKMLSDNKLSIVFTHSYCQATFMGLFLRSQKIVPDNKLSIISTDNNCQATFLGYFLRSQKLCLTISCTRHE